MPLYSKSHAWVFQYVVIAQECTIRRDNKLEQREGQFTCFSNVTGNINILFH